MIAVFHRESRAFLHSPMGYLFFALFVLSSGLFVTTYHFYYGSSALEFTLTYIMVCMALLMPLLVFPLFSASKVQRERALLRQLPLSARDVFLGKYLTALLMLGLSCLILSLLPLLFSLYGSVNFLTAYAAIFGFFLFSHTLLTVNLFLSITLRKKAIGIIVSYGVTVVAYLLGFLSTLAPDLLSEILRYLSLFEVFTPFIYGVLDLRAVVFYLSVSALFFLLSLERFKKIYEG